MAVDFTIGQSTLLSSNQENGAKQLGQFQSSDIKRKQQLDDKEIPTECDQRTRCLENKNSCKFIYKVIKEANCKWDILAPDSHDMLANQAQKYKRESRRLHFRSATYAPNK